MNIFCLESFKDRYEYLIKKKPYKSLEKDIVDYFFNKSVDQLKSGVRLNNSEEQPFIKKRLEGSGGFRLYYLLLIKEENVYLMFVHPKTGAEGADNIDNAYKAHVYKEVLECIKTNNLIKLTLCDMGTSIQFNKV